MSNSAKRSHLLRSTILVSVAAASLNGYAALAQETESENAAVETRQSDDRIVVTGSRIRRDAFSADSPIEVFDADAAALQGSLDIADFLQSSTVAAGSPQVTAATSAQFVQNGGLGAETLSLRGLGANRTLVLLNGRRAGPAGVRGGVSAFDLNVIPLSAIQRVEVLKDGASSVYGSDAVAGVVNIITNNEDGGTFDAFASVPEAGAGLEFRINGSYGDSFERGRFRVTADYYRQEELAQGDRDYFQCGEAYVSNPDGTRADVVDPRTGAFACEDLLWGHVWTYDYADGFANGTTNLDYAGTKLIQYDYNGALAANGLTQIGNNHANPYWMGTPDGWYAMNQSDPLMRALTDYDHPFQDASTMVPDTERFTLFAEGEYQLTNNARLYGEALFNRRETYNNSYRQYWTYIYNSNFDFATFDVDPAAGDPRSAGWTGAQWLSPTAVTDHADSSVAIDYMRFVAGVDGQGLPFLPDWTWDASLQFSRSDGEYWNERVFDDAISPYQFSVGSCAGTVTPVRGANCVDVNWLSPSLLSGNPTPEERAFLFGEETGTTVYEQLSFEGVVSGDLFTLPAGPVGVAVGVHYRTDEITDTPGEITLANNAWGSSGAGITAGDDTTQAIFGEAVIPLLAGQPLAEELTLTVSGRYTDVESYGTGDTYKVGLNWAINDLVRLRATHGTSFRTPALFELYLADQTSFSGQRNVDPCINWQDNLDAGNITQRIASNCAADGIPDDHSGAGSSATIVTGGGLGVLEAETSESTTFGVIFTPSFINLRVAVDYFEIEMENQVDQLGANRIVSGCYNSDDFANEPLCDLFTRNPNSGNGANLITEVRDSFINVNSQINRGIDINADYFHEFGFGDLTVNSRVAIQLEDQVDLLGGNVEDTNGEAGNPELVGELNFNFVRGDWSAFWGMRYVGQTSNFDSYYDGNSSQTYLGNDVVYKLRTEAVVYHSASIAREFDTVNIRAGVSNIFDEHPPAVTTISGEYSTVGTSAFYSQYDWMGRRFYVNFSKTF